MPTVSVDVFELVFAAAVVAVFGSALAVVFGRVSRSTLAALAGIVGAAAAAAWVVFALQPSRELAVAAGGITVCAALQLGALALQRLVAQARQVDRRLEEAEARFDALVSAEVEARAAELERTSLAPAPTRSRSWSPRSGRSARRGAPPSPSRSTPRARS